MPNDETMREPDPPTAGPRTDQLHTDPEHGTLAQSADMQARVAASFDPTATHAPLAPDFVIPGYEVRAPLGRGAMGAVYLAFDLKLKREVALKTLRTTDARPEVVARFWAEAEVMAAVRHPHVVQVYELGKDVDRPFMAMEYLAGGSLHQWLAERRQLAPREAAALVEKIARGAAAAHELGIVHRDLKPSNILLEGPRAEDRGAGDSSAPGTRSAGTSPAPKVADFGLAKRVANDLTQTQTLLGTPSYMAPEQAAGRAKFVGPQADVWALGVILYECVAGTRPFEGDTVATLFSHITSAEPAALRARVKGLPRDLDTIVAKCLAKEPQHRYPTAAELADDLGRFLRGEPIAARPAGVVARVRRWCRRRPVAAVVLLMSVVLAGAQSVAVVLTARAYEAERRAKGVAEERERAADRERATAEERSREAAAARDAATTAAAETADTAALLVRLVETSDPLGSQPLSQESRDHRLGDAAARELLAIAVAHVRSRPPQRTAAGAALLDTLGSACRSRGLVADARALLNEAHAIRVALCGEESAEVAASLHNLGWLAQDEGRYPEAQALYRRALDMRRRTLGDDHALVTATMFNLAWVTAHQFDGLTSERARAAEDLLRDILARQARWPKGGHGDPVMTRLVLALIVYSNDAGRSDEVEKLLKEIVSLIPSYPKSKPFLEAAGRHLRARRLWDQKKFAESIDLRVQVLGELRTIMGDDHIIIGYALGDLAGAYSATGRVEEGLKAFDDALRIGRKYFPGGHWLIARSLAEAGDKLADLGRPEDAEHRFREAMEMAAAVGRPDLWQRARDGRANALTKLGRPADADALRALPVPKAP